MTLDQFVDYVVEGLAEYQRDFQDQALKELRGDNISAANRALGAAGGLEVAMDVVRERLQSLNDEEGDDI